MDTEFGIIALPWGWLQIGDPTAVAQDRVSSLGRFHWVGAAASNCILDSIYRIKL
jgi:hypothetical protein